MALRAPMMPDIYVPHGERATRLWFVVPLRLYAGYHFLAAAIGKIAGKWFSNPEGLLDAIGPVIASPDYPYGFYRALYQSVIEPYPGLFAMLVVFGELFVGLALLTGTLTRLASYIGLFMLLNFFLAVNAPVLAMPHNTTSFMAILTVLILTAAGRAYGVDHYLTGKVPAWMA